MRSRGYLLPVKRPPSLEGGRIDYRNTGAGLISATPLPSYFCQRIIAWMLCACTYDALTSNCIDLYNYCILQKGQEMQVQCAGRGGERTKEGGGNGGRRLSPIRLVTQRQVSFILFICKTASPPFPSFLVYTSIPTLGFIFPSFFLSAGVLEENNSPQALES